MHELLNGGRSAGRLVEAETQAARVRLGLYLEVGSNSPVRVARALTTLGATPNACDFVLADGTIVGLRPTASNETPGLLAVVFRREDGKEAQLRSGQRTLRWF